MTNKKQVTITIDDTWANSIVIENYNFDGENYSGTMKLTIYDQFEGSYKPFETVMELEYPFEGSIN